jgi:hypothetical protein
MIKVAFPMQPEAVGIVSVLTGHPRFIFSMGCGFSATGVG